MDNQPQAPRKSSKSWVLIGVAAFIGMLAVQPIGQIAKEITTKAIAPENPYKKIQDDLVRKLPMEVDEITTLVDVTVEPSAVTYFYKLSDDTRGFEVERLRKVNSPGICRAWQDSFRDGGIRAAVYRYMLRGTSYSFTVTPADCGID